MKDKLTQISDDLNHNIITEKEAKEQLLILCGVVWRSEPCGLLHSTDWNGKCFKCGEQVFVREPK